MLPLLSREEAEAAQKCLLLFVSQSQILGQALVENEQVQVPVWDMFEAGYRARIKQYWVTASYENGKWLLRCQCPHRPHCEHGYALLALLLAQYAPGPTILAHEADLDDLSEGALQKVLGRRLMSGERQFLRSLRRLWTGFQARGRFDTWDFYQLNWYDWAHVLAQKELFPEPPKNFHQFWLYLAHGVSESRPDLIPQFLKPATDFSLIADQLAKLKRQQALAFWKRSLQALADDPADDFSEVLDFRLRLFDSEARLECRRESGSDFQPVKKTPAKEFLRQFAQGALPVVPECSALCEALAREAAFGPLDWSLAGESLPKVLNVLLRVPLLQDRIVTRHGVPFARATEPLRWKLDELPDSAGDAQLSLVLPDGSQPAKLILALDGKPTLYLTEDTLHTGPAVYSFLPPNISHILPGAVLETAAGIEFLRRLGVELPPRLQQMVERIRFQPRIVCSVAPSYSGSSSEMLAVSVTAATPDGAQAETLNESGWSRAAAPAGAKRKQRGKITVLDRTALKPIPALLRTLGLKWDWYAKRWRCRVGKNFPETFLPWLASIPPSIEVALDPLLASLRNAPVAATLQLDCTETEIDWFDLKVSLNVSDTELTPDEIKLLLNARGQFVRLKNKGWRKLDLQVSDEDDEALARVGLSTAEFSSEPQRLHALQLADDAARKFLPDARAEQIRRRAAEIKTRVTPAVPETIQAQLRPYQLEGFHFLAYLTTNHFGGILADDMGLGKTLQTLTWLEWVRGNAGPKPAPSLVVCPKSVMETWRNEVANFAPGLRVRLWKGANPDYLKSALEDTDLLVLNYAQLRSVGEALTRVKWQAAVLDEGQYIKNPDSQTAQVARALPAQYRLALSGTPIENRLLDLWSLMAFAMPGVLGNRTQFGRQFNINSDPLARRRLAARVRPFLLRRTKAQVAKDLPERIEEDLLCELEGEQKTLYRAEFKHAQQMLLKVKTSKELNEFRFHFLTSLLRPSGARQP